MKLGNGEKVVQVVLINLRVHHKKVVDLIGTIILMIVMVQLQECKEVEIIWQMYMVPNNY